MGQIASIDPDNIDLRMVFNRVFTHFEGFSGTWVDGSKLLGVLFWRGGDGHSVSCMNQENNVM